MLPRTFLKFDFESHVQILMLRYIKTKNCFPEGSESLKVHTRQGQRLDFQSGGAKNVVTKEAQPWFAATRRENYSTLTP